MLTSSFAPGAAAAKYWKVPLEASTLPETRPPSCCSHSSSAWSGSIEMLQRRSERSVSLPGASGGRPKSAGRRPWSPSSTTIVRSPRSAASRPRAAASVVLPTPPLPVTKSSSRSSIEDIASGVWLKRARPASTYNRAHEHDGGAPDRRADLIRLAGARRLRGAGLEHRRGSDAGLHERGGAAAHPRHGGAAPVEPLEGRAVAQGRHERQRADRARPAPGLRR